MNIEHRAIIQETPLYYLLAPDWSVTIGYGELQPKMAGSRRVWTVRVWNHLKAFSDNLNITGIPKERADQITYAPSFRYGYSYLGGPVAVIPGEGKVEISLNHPQLDNVIAAMLRLFWQPKVKVLVMDE